MKKLSKSQSKPTAADKADIQKAVSQKPEVLFPIVGIGASAGGLEALEHFLRRIPGKVAERLESGKKDEPVHIRTCHYPYIDASNVPNSDALVTV